VEQRVGTVYLAEYPTANVCYVILRQGEGHVLLTMWLKTTNCERFLV